MTAALMKPGAGNFLDQFELEIPDLNDLFTIGDGDTSSKELECIYDPEDDSLVGGIRIKRPSGFSGGLCTDGSREHVTFWGDFNNDGIFGACLGTASVSVYDTSDLPRSGLEFAVHLPAELLRLRLPCQEAPRLIGIRAILSWAVPMPCATPDATPTWGNRLDTLIHVKPDELITGLEPLLSSVGRISVSDIDGNGLAQNAIAVTTGAFFNEAPFGGRVNLAGKIVGGRRRATVQ